LRSHSKSYIKSVWRTLKTFSGTTKQNPPISIDTFYGYFKDLNNSADDDDNELDINTVCDNPLYHAILNDEITETDILEV